MLGSMIGSPQFSTNQVDFQVYKLKHLQTLPVIGLKMTIKSWGWGSSANIAKKRGGVGLL